MSKVSFSRELLGTIKFVFDKTKSRTLNATQAYDTSTSQIVLASYSATSTIKGPTKGLGKVVPDNSDGFGTVAVHMTQTGLAPQTGPESTFGLKAREEEVYLLLSAPTSLALALITPVPTAPAAKNTTLKPVGTVKFDGLAYYRDGITGPNLPASAKSNAAKEIFAGNITVGTGLYRDWQNKYAVLKVDLLTNKAILRVYNE